MDKNLPRPQPSKHNVYAAWLFGTLLLLFYMGVFTFAHDEIPEFKHKQLAILSALLCALFTFFFIGSLQISFQYKTKCSKLALQSGGGAAAFVLILWWWNNPSFTPITKQIDHPDVSVISQPITSVEQTTISEASQATIKKIPLDHKNIVQITSGKNSPAIISNGDVSINSEQ
jgi:hypothetical protein